MLQKTPVEKWIYDELKNLRQIQFRFGEDRRPFDLATEISQSLQHLPPSDVLKAAVELYDYDPEGISDVLARMTLGAVRVQHSAKVLAEKCTDKDTSYDSPL